ncbi:hypothetical protein HD554DRAFT_1781443 [Boletus coccyginus]|nr:hypothetical protein HD554DRAFT_1781443 [Boletus coccyginus]
MRCRVSKWNSLGARPRNCTSCTQDITILIDESFLRLEPPSPSECTSMPAIRPKNPHTHLPTSTAGRRVNPPRAPHPPPRPLTRFSVPGPSIPTLFVLSLIMYVMLREKRAKRSRGVYKHSWVQGSSPSLHGSWLRCERVRLLGSMGASTSRLTCRVWRVSKSRHER